MTISSQILSKFVLQRLIVIEFVHIFGPNVYELAFFRPPDKSAYWKIIFLISHPKHMLWVLKRTVSMRRFF